MIFNSFQFLWLFPIIFLLYYGIRGICGYRYYGSWDNLFLLIVSYALYMQWHPLHGLILLGLTAWSYLGGKVIFSCRNQQRRKFRISLFVLGSLFPLFFYKYLLFICQITFSIDSSNSYLATIFIPIGISFYTFQTISYLVDVYRNKILELPSWLDYMLFVSFFPQILSGPISRSADLLPQIRSERPFNEEQAFSGIDCLIWGSVLKTVIADRMGIYVDVVFANYDQFSGLTCLLASFLYSIEIYCDFAGYSLMALGASRLLGFEIPNNFNHPYAAYSVTDFWHRWHISLSCWLKDYIYIPLGGSRCSIVRSYINILLTFFASGIWHGANWTFILWGTLHGVIQIIEKKLGLNKSQFTIFPKKIQAICTLLFINFTWIIFRSQSVTAAIGMISRILTDWQLSVMIPNSKIQAILIAFALLFFVITEVRNYRKGITTQKIFNCSLPFRLLQWVVCLCMISLLGVLDTSQFIYVSF